MHRIETQEQQHKTYLSIWHGMENGIGRWMIGKLMWLKLGKKVHATWKMNRLQDKWGCHHLRAPKASQDKTKLGETSLTNSHSISMLFYMNQAPLFVVFRGSVLRWEIQMETPWKFRPKTSHMEGATLLLLLISLKLLFTPPFYVRFKSTQKKLQKETSFDAHLLMLVPYS